MDQPTFDELNLIPDPETGLALLAKCRGPKTPEQEQEHQFWRLQFTEWRNQLAGDVQAVGRASVDCELFGRSPPMWLLKAISSLCVQQMSPNDKRAHGAMMGHFRRWKAVQLVRGRHPKDPLNYGRVDEDVAKVVAIMGGTLNHERKVISDDIDAVCEEAAKLVAEMGGTGKAETVRKSYELIKRAGGAQVTLGSYRRARRIKRAPGGVLVKLADHRRAVKKHDRQRKEK